MVHSSMSAFPAIRSDQMSSCLLVPDLGRIVSSTANILILQLCQCSPQALKLLRLFAQLDLQTLGNISVK